MIYLLIITVTLLASMVGAVCGIGGGVVIKPVLDSLGIMSVSAVSFLSGCTVLCMTGYTVITNLKKRNMSICLQISIPLSFGAAVGGIAGKNMFHVLKSSFENVEFVGVFQSGFLFLLTLGTLFYTMNKRRIQTKQMKKVLFCILIGSVLGILSSFLGIGGGPFNLIFLSFFFSMETKEAAQTSLFIILFSQITSLSSILLTAQMPEIDFSIMVGMAFMGILGGILGRKVNERISSQTVDNLFVGITVLIMGICIYNIFHIF